MTLLRFLLWCSFLSFAAQSALAQTDSAAAQRLMQQSGLWEQLSDIAPQVRSGFVAAISQSGGKASAAEVDRITQAVDAAYAPERLRAACLATMSRELDMRNVAALDRWYDSAAGRAITQLEQAQSARRADPQSAVAEGAALLDKLPPPRRALLEDLGAATRSAELMTELTISTALAAQQGAASVSPDMPGLSTKELRSMLEARRPQLTKTFAGLSLASFALAYATLPTPELAQYVDFLKSDAGRHFSEVAMRAFSAAMVGASIEFGRSLPGVKDRANT